MSSSVLYRLSGLLKCLPRNINEKLCRGRTKELVVSLLQHQKYRTNYYDQNGWREIIQIDGITSRGADQIMALGNLPYPYNCTIVQFFMLRHNICLKYPSLPCIEMDTCQGKQFYPLELVMFEDTYKQLEHASLGYKEGAMRELVFEHEVKRFLVQLEKDEYAEIEDCHEEEEECRGICANLLSMIRIEEYEVVPMERNSNEMDPRGTKESKEEVAEMLPEKEEDNKEGKI